MANWDTRFIEPGDARWDVPAGEVWYADYAGGYNTNSGTFEKTRFRGYLPDGTRVFDIEVGWGDGGSGLYGPNGIGNYLVAPLEFEYDNNGNVNNQVAVARRVDPEVLATDSITPGTRFTAGTGEYWLAAEHYAESGTSFDSEKLNGYDPAGNQVLEYDIGYGDSGAGRYGPKTVRSIIPPGFEVELAGFLTGSTLHLRKIYDAGVS